MSPVSQFSPAKLNLFLAITGRRPDGFHDLVSLVAPLTFGDTLEAQIADDEETRLTTTRADLAVDDTNLVLKAARAFRQRTGWAPGVRFHLDKRIPLGAGLGGGSSNAVAALRCLNTLAGHPLSDAQLEPLAAGLGSDCVLFLRRGPVVMRGRGERVESLPPPAARELSGREVVVFKPAFGISTPWAYAQMIAAGPSSYLAPAEAEERLRRWNEGEARGVENLLFNNLERPAFAKFLALPTLLEQIRSDFGLMPRMSGSGSACFALLPSEFGERDFDALRSCIVDAWGTDAWVVRSSLA